MIRTLQLVCSECGNNFLPEGELYYRDNYMSTNIRDTKFICPVCRSNRFFFTSFNPEQNLPHGAVCSVCGTRLTKRSILPTPRRRRWPKQVV